MTTALAVASSHLAVLVDLSECTYIDSAVLGELLVAWSRLRERDGALELVVRRDAHALRRTLEVATAALRYHETRSAGITRLDSAGRIRALRRTRQDLRGITAEVDQLRATAEARRTGEAQGGGLGVTVVRARVADEAVDLQRPAAESARPNRTSGPHRD